MFGGCFEVPMLIRLVVGRSWGARCTALTKPTVYIFTLSRFNCDNALASDTILSSYAYAAAEYKNPVISIEHRLMYDLEFETEIYDKKRNPLHSSYIVRKGNDVTIVATSIIVLEAFRAAEHLNKEAGISCEIIDLHSCSHPQKRLSFRVLRKLVN